jgi:hypothetical protein
MAEITGPDAVPLAVAAVFNANQGGAAAPGRTGIGRREDDGD